MELSSHVTISLSESDLQKPDKKDLNCGLCKKQFGNMNALRMHKVKTHNQVCSEADFRLRHRQQNWKQEVEKRYLCPVPTCPRSKEPGHFIAFKLLKQHYMKVHTRKTLSCEMCGSAKFSLKRDLKYHQKRCCSLKSTCEPGPSYNGELRADNAEGRRNKLNAKHLSKTNWKLPNGNGHNVHVKNIFVIARVENPPPPCFVPVVPVKSVESVSTQTTLDESFGQMPQGVDTQRLQRPKELNKDVSTNVTTCDLCSSQQELMLPIESISFQSDGRFSQGDFYAQKMSSATQSLNYTVSQNDCGVQSNLEYLPETRHVETHIDDLDFEEIWRNIETQTSEPYGNDALTQTVTDFMDCGIMTDEPYQPWKEI